MMDRRDVRAFERRLAQCWRENADAEFGVRWSEGVMDAVRSAASRSRSHMGPSIESVMRKALLGAAAATVVAIAVFGTRAASLDPSYELARLIVTDPQGLLQLVLVF